MKLGEFIEETKNHSTNYNITSSMFANLHHAQSFNHQLPPQPISTVAIAPSSSANDGATIEVVRRPRGRPPGSKNKPKHATFIVKTRDDHVEKPSMSPYILEIPTGVDIIDSIHRFCEKQNMGLCVLNGSGIVTNVTLMQPSNTAASTVTFHGEFSILSISATIVLENSSLPNGFTISLAGPHGQVVGGAVTGPLLSAGTVYLIAATFNNPSYHKFPAEDEDGGQSPPVAVSGGGDSGHPLDQSFYTSNRLPSDIIRPPTARQPPPPY